MFKLFTSSSVDQLRKDTSAQIDAVVVELDLLKKENKILHDLIAEQQFSLNLLITASQQLAEELNLVQALLTKGSSPGDSRSFSFSFRDKSDDDLPN